MRTLVSASSLRRTEFIVNHNISIISASDLKSSRNWLYECVIHVSDNNDYLNST